MNQKHVLHAWKAVTVLWYPHTSRTQAESGLAHPKLLAAPQATSLASARTPSHAPVDSDFPLASPFKFQPQIRLASSLLPLGPGQFVSKLK